MQILFIVFLIVVVGLLANKFMNQRTQSDEKNDEHEQTLNAETVHAAPHDHINGKTEDNLNEKEKKDMENNNPGEKKGTRDLLLETLTQSGCQYEIGEEDGDIQFGYQGEYFVARATNSSPFIHLYDTHWGRVELYDIDEFARLKKAINQSNIDNSVTAVYTIDQEGSNVIVHSKSVILFIQDIPDIEDYLRMELREFFKVHETIHREMVKQREKEAKQQ